MPRQDYEARQERRRERLEQRAETKAKEAERRFATSDQMSEMMAGTPILIGHHSEKRHRRDIDRMHNHMRKGLEASKASDELSRRAASVGTGGISSDDPEAVRKLKEERDALEHRQARMKAVNKAHKAFLKDPTTALLEGLSANERQRVENYKPAYSWEPHPFAPYELSNNNANIRRIKGRIQQLEAAAKAPEREAIEGNGWKVWEDRDENRVFICHDAKPSTEVRQSLKSQGFRWNRHAGAWSRLLNNAGWYAAVYLATNGKLD